MSVLLLRKKYFPEYFPVYLAKYFKTAFLQNTCGTDTSRIAKNYFNTTNSRYTAISNTTISTTAPEALTLPMKKPTFARVLIKE